MLKHSTFHCGRVHSVRTTHGKQTPSSITVDRPCGPRSSPGGRPCPRLGYSPAGATRQTPRGRSDAAAPHTPGQIGGVGDELETRDNRTMTDQDSKRPADMCQDPNHLFL